MIKSKMLLVLGILLSLKANAQSSKRLEAFIHTGYNQVQVNPVNISTISTRFSMGWLIRTYLNLTAAYSMVIANSGSSNFSGYDIGAKYFFHHHLGILGWNKEGTSVLVRPTLAPYVQPIFAQRSIHLDNGDINFTGPGVRTGLIWFYKRKFIVDFGLEYLNLSGPLGGTGSMSYSSTQAFVGIGTQF